MRKFVIDMMGSDAGSAMTLAAVKTYHKLHPEDALILVGKTEEFQEAASFATLVHASDVIEMEAGALEVIRRKESSMVVAMHTLLEQHADAVISAGSTGAFLSAATLILKRIPGVLRPALVTGFPNLGRGNFVTLLDVGASNTNTAEEIAQFAYMGSLYSQGAYGIEKPIVKLLSNGSEEGKGSPVGKEAYPLLKADPKVDFQGNIEASQIFAGSADVVVTDGYTGNIMLKSFEGMAKAMGKLMKQGFTKNFKTKMGYLLAKSGIDTIKDTMNTKKVGGAMLLGVNGLVVKAHGNSDPEAFESAMEVAAKLTDAKMIEKIAAGFAKVEQK